MEVSFAGGSLPCFVLCIVLGVGWVVSLFSLLPYAVFAEDKVVGSLLLLWPVGVFAGLMVGWFGLISFSLVIAIMFVGVRVRKMFAFRK